MCVHCTLITGIENIYWNEVGKKKVIVDILLVKAVSLMIEKCRVNEQRLHNNLLDLSLLCITSLCIQITVGYCVPVQCTGADCT